MMRRLMVLAIAAMGIAPNVYAQEVSYEVDLKNPPPNTFLSVGDGKSAAIGETAKFDLAIETTYSFRNEIADTAKKHIAMLAYTSMYNAARIESVSKKLAKSERDLSELKFRRVSLGVVSFKEVERGGVKLQRFEIATNVDMFLGQPGRASQHKRYEIWEFDGKKLKLVEAPDDWGIIFL